MLVNFFEGPPFKFKHSIKEHQRFVNCVRFSPDGSKFISVGSDKQGLLFDGKTGEPAGKLAESGAHSAGIYSASWAPDNKRVLTASADKTCKVWNTDNGECIAYALWYQQYSHFIEPSNLEMLWKINN